MEKKFSIEQKSLFAILAAMQPICSKRTTTDTTSNILFQIGHKELILKSTDLEISLQASCQLLQSSVIDTEIFLVSGRRIFELVKELDGTIECKLKNNQLLLKAGSVNLALHTKDAQEFPPFPERIENLMQFETGALRNLLDKVAFLIPQSNANPALNGLFIEINAESTKMTTTDGHCLASVSTSQYTLDEQRTWLLPRRAVFELKKILESIPDSSIFLGVCGNQLVFSGEAFNFFSKLLVDPFPHYKAVLEKNAFIGATIDKSRFIKTLRRATCLLSGQFIATQFSFSKNGLRVAMNNKEVGTLEEELPLEGFEGGKLDVRFYAPYLLSGLQTFDEAQVTFFLKNNTKPIIFESITPAVSLTFLVMPVSPVTAEQ